MQTSKRECFKPINSIWNVILRIAITRKYHGNDLCFCHFIIIIIKKNVYVRDLDFAFHHERQKNPENLVDPVKVK